MSSKPRDGVLAVVGVTGYLMLVLRASVSQHCEAIITLLQDAYSEVPCNAQPGPLIWATQVPAAENVVIITGLLGLLEAMPMSSTRGSIQVLVAVSG